MFTLSDKLLPMDYKVVSAFLESVSEKWQEIGLKLSLSEQTCHRIQENNGGNPEQCCSQMIEECLIERGVVFNWPSLTETLRNLNMEHLADTILLDWGVYNILLAITMHALIELCYIIQVIMQELNRCYEILI